MDGEGPNPSYGCDHAFEQFLSFLGDVVDEGLATIQDVQVRFYRKGKTSKWDTGHKPRPPAAVLSVLFRSYIQSLSVLALDLRPANEKSKT